MGLCMFDSILVSPHSLSFRDLMEAQTYLRPGAKTIKAQRCLPICLHIASLVRLIMFLLLGQQSAPCGELSVKFPSNSPQPFRIICSSYYCTGQSPIIISMGNYEFFRGHLESNGNIFLRMFLSQHLPIHQTATAIPG